MKYLITCVLVWMITVVAWCQNEDKPFCRIPQDSIVKHKITMLTSEDKSYLLGLCRKDLSYTIIYTFDSAGNIISQDWISLKTKKRDHVNTYTYDNHGNLIVRKIDGENLHVKYDYYFRYDSSGRIDQYYTEPRVKTLFRYDDAGRLKTKLTVTPTDTLERWIYEYQNNKIVQETNTSKGLRTLVVTQYVYIEDKLDHEIHLVGSDTIYKVIYSYDARGNKLSEVQTHRMTGDEKTWKYGTSGQLIFFQDKSGEDIETETYTYSPAGMLIEVKEKVSFLWGITEKSKLFYTFKP